MANEKLEVVFVLGRPGAGKGTVCKKIEDGFGYVHLSAGELLRQERERADSPIRELVDKHYREGSLAAPDIMCSLLETAVGKSESKKFIFDSFPINMDNLDVWENRKLWKQMALRFVLFLNCPQEECEDRILKRGAAGSGRDDDVADKLGKRFSRYEEDTVRVVKHFQERELLREVDASTPPDEVYQQASSYFL